MSVEIEQTVFAALHDDIAPGFLTQNPVDDEAISGALVLLALLADPSLQTLDALHLSIARRLGVGRLATAAR